LSVKFLKPVDGLDVFIPSKGRLISKDGENVVVDAYVEGRIACGSLVEIQQAKTNKKENVK